MQPFQCLRRDHYSVSANSERDNGRTSFQTLSSKHDQSKRLNNLMWTQTPPLWTHISTPWTKHFDVTLINNLITSEVAKQ